jgi:hypothetical protein
MSLSYTTPPQCGNRQATLTQKPLETSRNHAPQKLTGLISLCTNPVSSFSVPIQTVHFKPR